MINTKEQVAKLIQRLNAAGYSRYRIAKEIEINIMTIRWWHQMIFMPNQENLKKLTQFAKKAGVMTIIACLLSSPIQAQQGEVQYGKASWYSIEACKFNLQPETCKTADGTSLFTLEEYRILFAASPKLKFGTIVKVTNIKNNRSVLVEIRDRGPNLRLNRVIDLSKRAFEKIADPRSGIINVKTEIIR